MRDALIGYLLDALEPRERLDVEQQLASDPDLQRELAALRRCFEPLEHAPKCHEPPAGLATRTCAFVSARVELQRHVAGLQSWRWQDMVVAAGIAVAASLLVFPAVAESRSQARLVACQNHLRSLGAALARFSDLRGGWFPEIPREGPLAVAGSYAVQLREAGLLDEPETLVCPGSPLASSGFVPVSRAELELATDDELANLQRRAGGSYGYSLGYVLDDRYYGGARNTRRSAFPLMSDEPADCLSGSSHHGRGGQNVLFEDGHVEFVRSCRLGGCGDHIFQNARGQVGPGIGPDDAVIGASHASPLIRPVAE